jgi:hypothetical protein
LSSVSRKWAAASSILSARLRASWMDPSSVVVADASHSLSAMAVRSLELADSRVCSPIALSFSSLSISACVSFSSRSSSAMRTFSVSILAVSAASASSASLSSRAFSSALLSFTGFLGFAASSSSRSLSSSAAAAAASSAASAAASSSAFIFSSSACLRSISMSSLIRMLASSASAPSTASLHRLCMLSDLEDATPAAHSLARPALPSHTSRLESDLASATSPRSSSRLSIAASISSRSVLSSVGIFKMALCVWQASPQPESFLRRYDAYSYRVQST